jgi:predicted phosphate transport protein (TIGR00153 family)
VRLIPRDEQFYELFTQLAERLSLAARLLHQLFREPERHSDHVQAIKVAEHEADEITREIIDRLDRTFITPFDREDIHELASALDEVVDLLDGAARRVEIFRITTVHQAAVTLSEVMVRAAKEVEDAVRGMKDPKVVNLKAHELKRLEEEGDAIYHESMGALFDGALDAIEVIKWKELYDKVEDALDQAEDVANVLQSIALKNG